MKDAAQSALQESYRLIDQAQQLHRDVQGEQMYTAVAGAGRLRRESSCLVYIILAQTT